MLIFAAYGLGPRRGAPVPVRGSAGGGAGALPQELHQVRGGAGGVFHTVHGEFYQERVSLNILYIVAIIELKKYFIFYITY